MPAVSAVPDAEDHVDRADERSPEVVHEPSRKGRVLGHLRESRRSEEGELLEGFVVGLPCGGEARNRGRRESGSIIAEQRRKSLLEVTRRESAQVQDRQHLGHLGRAAHIGWEGLAPLMTAVITVRLQM